MSTFIKTLKDKLKTNSILPRTVLKAVADDNGNYINSSITASDVNSIPNKLPKYTSGSSDWDTTPTENSTKAVTSGGVASAISALSNRTSITVSIDETYGTVDAFYTRGFKINGVVAICFSINVNIPSGWTKVGTITGASVTASRDYYFTLYSPTGIKYGCIAGSDLFLFGPVDNSQLRGSVAFIDGM